MDPSTMLGPVDLLEPYIEYVLLVVVLANMFARAYEHRLHVRQAEDGADAVARSPFRVGANVLLVLTSFYFLSVHHHAGIIMSVLVLGVVIADIFEFEARKVEARKEEPLDRPMGSITASVIVLLYAAFQSLFFLVAPYWNAVV